MKAQMYQHMSTRLCTFERGMYNVSQDTKKKKKRKWVTELRGATGRQAGRRVRTDIDSFTDGRLSLEKQTLQNEELK